MPPEWKLEKYTVGAYVWNNPNNNSSQLFQQKKVFVKGSEIIREENLFIGPHSYKTVDGTFRENVYISYNFKNKDEVAFWICKYYGSGVETGKEISPSESYQIIEGWQKSIDSIKVK